MKRSMVVITCLLITTFVTDSSQCWGFRNLKEGKPAPDFKLKDLDGNTHSPAQSKGKVKIILYWRPGQERSLNALKALKGISEEFSNQPLQILAITKDADKLSKIKDLKKSIAPPYPILLDREAEVYAKFGVFVFPATALIDKKGIYRFHHGGFRDNYYEEISGQVKILLGLTTKEALEVENKKDVLSFTDDQKRAINQIKLGKTLRQRGMDEKALQNFKKAVELDDANPEGHILLGILLLDQQETDQALQHLKKGFELDPKSLEAKIGLGRAYRMKGHTDNALGILQDGLSLCPNSAIIHLELGKTYESLGKTNEALEHYKASAEFSLKTNK